MPVDDDKLFSELFAYYRDLQNRRWQYFVGLLVVDGLLLNAWTDLNLSINLYLSLVLCIGAIFVGIAFLRLLSRSRRRINEVGIELNKLVGRRLMSTGSLGAFGLGGITIWLYLSVIILTLPWFIILWSLNLFIAIIITIIFIGSITAIEWTLAKETEASPKMND